MGMDIKSPTLVTALYDIGRDTWDNFTMSYDTYIYWMRNILYLDSNLVIYTEDKFKDTIINIRREVDYNLEKTILIVQPLENSYAYEKFYEPLSNLMSTEEFRNSIYFDVPEMTKPLYNVLMFAKLFYILDSYKNKFFNADMYIWADAGTLRYDNPEKQVSWPNMQKINDLDNTKITFFCHHPYIRIDSTSYKEHALSQMRYIQGTMFFVPISCIENICSELTDVVMQSIQGGYIGSDEKMFDFIYLRDPSKYNLIQCGWREYVDLFS
jgi:hypothetical protein